MFIGVLHMMGLISGLPTDAAGSSANLRAEMAGVARVTRGPVGAAEVVVEGGRIVALHGEQRFPMQSVHKISIAMTVLPLVDGGTLRLDRRLKISPGDMAPPSRGRSIRDKYPNGTDMTVLGLLDAMMDVSDGTASDVLLEMAGGPEQVTAYVRGLGVRDIVVATTERAMAQGERVQYRDWATPDGMADLLRALQEGEGLSAPRAANDAGLVTLPGGRHLIVVVVVSDTRADEATHDAVIAKIARAAWNCRTGLEGRR